MEVNLIKIDVIEKKKEKKKERSVDVESMYFDVIMTLDQFCRLIAHALFKTMSCFIVSFLGAN